MSTRLHHHARPQKQTDIKAISHGVLAEGAEHIVSYDGTGQYSGNGSGVSACGLAALNFARVIFSIEQSNLQDEALLQAVLARECVEVRVSYKPPARAQPYLPRKPPQYAHCGPVTFI